MHCYVYTMATPDTTVGVESSESVRGIKPSTPNIKTENCYFLHPAAAAPESKTASPENGLVDWREELKRFEEFGLGLGVDATNPSPFANRKSFHVRQIDLDTIICIWTRAGRCTASFKSSRPPTRTRFSSRHPLRYHTHPFNSEQP